jgi:hypothetical protein
MWATLAAINLPFGDGEQTTQISDDLGMVEYWVYHIKIIGRK